MIGTREGGKKHSAEQGTKIRSICHHIMTLTRINESLNQFLYDEPRILLLHDFVATLLIRIWSETMALGSRVVGKSESHPSRHVWYQFTATEERKALSARTGNPKEDPVIWCMITGSSFGFGFGPLAPPPTALLRVQHDYNR